MSQRPSTRRPLDENAETMFQMVAAIVCFLSVGVLLALWASVALFAAPPTVPVPAASNEAAVAGAVEVSGPAASNEAAVAGAVGVSW